MFMKYPVIDFCLILLLFIKVDSQICKRLESVTRIEQISYLTSYRVTYHGQCYYGCIKTRWVTSMNRRSQPRRDWKTVKYCCPGYMREDDSIDDSDIVCKPICMPACNNGQCKSTGHCVCDIGYIVDAKNDHNCLPVCDKGCAHGSCVAPNSCHCDFGYSLMNETCHPICTEPCHNGTCVAPEMCECLSGFRISDKNVCESYCSNGCENGLCVAPETCRCNPGWNLTKSEDRPNKICKPFCSKPCGNGTCVAPETCKCWPSYRKSESDICVPECLSRWKLVDDKCVAQCQYSCGNGTCVAPNVCSCFTGYHVDSSSQLDTNKPICVPFCTDCVEKKGICVAPNQCVVKEVSKTTREDLGDVSQDYSTAASRDVTYYDSLTSEITDTYDDYNEHDNKMYDDLYSETDFATTEATSKGFDAQSGDSKAESLSNSWIQKNWLSIFIPILVITTAGVIMVLVWRWIPIIVFFKGRSYVVQGDPQENNGSHPFEDIQISSTKVMEVKEINK